MGIQIQHGWWALIHSKKIYSDVKKPKKIYKNKNIYLVYKGDTNIDRWEANFYNKLGIKTKTGINFGDFFDLMVFNDIIVQTFFPQKLIKKIKYIYKHSDVGGINLNKFYEEVLNAELPIKVVMMKNPLLAKEFKQQILNSFNKT